MDGKDVDWSVNASLEMFQLGSIIGPVSYRFAAIKLPQEMTKMLWLYLQFLILVSCTSAKLGCKDMDGKDVDWFAVIKLPQGIVDKEGKHFVYIDPQQDNWTLSASPISDKTSAIGATISQFYGINKNNTFAIAYNDNIPGKKTANSQRAHSKGVAVFDAEFGFWMIHSTPNFPTPYGKR
ncbi:unnamed protein product [Strongylus vulgaris]|uniref:Uncharacterized protein n=1 Tax=Strongylus vulgaris TaxID=40348 RepID=A0A3P7LV28_STRVU|nr:unnamed protein product [Strongylus vulgaris]